MPTPFMHMALAERLIHDPELPQSIRGLLEAGWGAFLLGSIAPDARVSSGMERGSTHFFEYQPKVDPPAVIAMLSRHADLRRTAISDDTRAAFVAGYAAHLAMDEIWCTGLLFPVFIDGGNWGDRPTKFLVLHALLAYLDRRDRLQLPESHYGHLAGAEPRGWLPFMDDNALCVWRDTIANQLAPQAESLTVEILAKRLSKPTDEFRALVEDEARMNDLTWANVPTDQLAAVEEMMYTTTRTAVINYLMDGQNR